MTFTNRFTCLFWIIVLNVTALAWAQEPTIVLPQGEIRGVSLAFLHV